MLSATEISDLVGEDVSRETQERLQALVELVEKWNPAINLIGKSTIPNLWTRHIADSLQLWPLADKKRHTWLDIGSGGGFPGLVVMILATELAPRMRVTLVESDTRKSAFLNTAMHSLGLTGKVLVERVESFAPQEADIVSARALAPLPMLLTYAERHLLPSGIALFPKGAGYRSEHADALASWQFTSETHPSKTDPEAVILKIGGVARV